MASLSRRWHARLGDAVVFYHLFARWGKPQEAASGHTFTYHKKSTYLFIFLAVIHEQLLELIAFHYLLDGKLSERMLMMTHMIHLYGILYLIGDYNLVRNGRVRIQDGYLDLNVGIRQSIRLRLDQIQHAELVQNERSLYEDRAVMRVAATPLFYRSMIGIEDDINCRLTLTEPVIGYGVLGRKRSINHIHLALDDAESFLKLVDRMELVDR